MTGILPVLGWLLALVLAAACVSCAAQILKGRRDGGLWAAAALWASLSLACLTGLGVIALVPGVPLDVLLFLAGAVPAYRMANRRPAPAGAGTRSSGQIPGARYGRPVGRRPR